MASKTDTTREIQDPIQWWNNLEDQWKKAYNEAFFNKGAVTAIPDESEFEELFSTAVLRFAGPRADFPSMSFELTNTSGLKGLNQVTVLILSYHRLTTTEELKSLTALQGLFLFNNDLKDLKGAESLKNLNKLYVQGNRIKSLKPLRELTNLSEVYCCDNSLKSLKGITKKHRKKLKQFVCLPNENIKHKEIIRVENKIGIRCKQG